MIYDNAHDPDAHDAAEDLASARERILAAQRERQAAGLLGGVLTTDTGKPWSELSTKGARYRANIGLPDIN